MQFDVVSIGALLVEIMRKELDQDFDQSGDFAGPFPSGDTPIFINAASKLGLKCGFIGTVGKDGFGKCVIERLKQSGVDTSCVRTVDGISTAVTFVAYFKDGSRKFLYHLHNAAAALLSPEDVQAEYLKNTKWIHLSGFALSGSESSRKAALKMLDIISDDVKVSFDPNIRVEALGVVELKKIVQPIIERACLFLPSSNEAMQILGLETNEQACELLAGRGKIVARKRGSKGCRIYAGNQKIDVPSFEIEEVDPTGAGDTFCAAFIKGLIKGWPLYDIGLYANAAAALSITKKGPMEGAPDSGEVEQFINSYNKEGGVQYGI